MYDQQKDFSSYFAHSIQKTTATKANPSLASLPYSIVVRTIFTIRLLYLFSATATRETMAESRREKQTARQNGGPKVARQISVSGKRGTKPSLE